jgi:hypothetical protein
MIMPTTVWPWNKKRYTCSAFPSFEQAHPSSADFITSTVGHSHPPVGQSRADKVFGKDSRRGGAFAVAVTMVHRALAGRHWLHHRDRLGHLTKVLDCGSEEGVGVSGDFPDNPLPARLSPSPRSVVCIIATNGSLLNVLWRPYRDGASARKPVPLYKCVIRMYWHPKLVHGGWVAAATVALLA